MFLMRFTERAYVHYTAEDVKNSPNSAVRLTFSNRHFDPTLGADLYNAYLDEYEYCEEVGFDGLMLNEHHNTPTCLGATMNLEAAILARTTKKPKIVLLGNPLPIFDNPIRLAEELAELDMISRGRLVSGFVRGTGIETLATNTNPVYNRERFEEAHDVIIKTWTTPGPFRWEGKHYHFRVVNPWIVPIQQPHPPIWVPGTSSPETAEWAARYGYTYVAFLTAMDMTEGLFDIYRRRARQIGYEPGPQHFGYLLCCYVADNAAKAEEEARHFLWRMGPTLRGPAEYFSPVGYRSKAGAEVALRRTGKPLAQQSLQELQDNYHIVAGTPDTVIERLRYIKDRLNIGH